MHLKVYKESGLYKSMDSFFKKENRFPCPPKMDTITKFINEYNKPYKPEEVKQSLDMVKCVEEFLNLYNMLATGNPPEDNLVNNLHNKTKELVYNTRIQYETEMENVEQAIQDFEEDFGTIEELAEDVEEHPEYYTLSRLYEELDNFEIFLTDISNIENFCEESKTKSEKIICTEKFVNLSHSASGRFIPVGCGGFESIAEEIVGRCGIPLVEDVTYQLEEECDRVFDCLASNKVKF